MEDKILQGIAYALPAFATAAVAYFMFGGFIKHEENEKKFEALLQKKRESLPLKLQAYERMILFCERMNPSKLLLRVNPIGEDAQSYLHLLLGNIEQEFEHNLVQQIYISENCWKAVVGSKLAIVNKLRQLAESSDTAIEFREEVLKEYVQIESPTETAIAYIKQEVKKLL